MVDALHGRLGPDYSQFGRMNDHPTSEQPVRRIVDPQLGVSSRIAVHNYVTGTTPAQHLDVQISAQTHETPDQAIISPEGKAMFAQLGYSQLPTTSRVEPAMTVAKAQQIGHHKLTIVEVDNRV